MISLDVDALMRSFVTSDFTVLNVAENSHPLKPLLFKIVGARGRHAGSLLLWVLIPPVFGAGVSLFGCNVPERLKARTLVVQAWISTGFFSFMLLTSNPFHRLWMVMTSTRCFKMGPHASAPLTYLLWGLRAQFAMRRA
ncbi:MULTISPECIES: hypothetical protein [Falsihalocynthiibacter]|uniref:hypothetical protein n=1 Tax=Falsihalocynthiibacter TaxID=2854182 RepID=UPI0030013362